MLPLRDNVPTRTFPIVTVGLIAANAAVWFWELHGSPWEQEVVRYGFYPCSVHGPCVGLALQHHPTWLVIIIREIPAFWFLGIWFLYQAYLGDLSLTHPGQSGGVALFAHVGGFL